MTSVVAAADTFTALGASMPMLEAGVLWLFIVASMIVTVLAFSSRLPIPPYKAVIDALW